MTRGEGRGVNVLEGRCNVDPLGVRIGEEVYDLLKELKDFVLGIRVGVDAPDRFSVCM
jgi:hypothetical protein